MAILALEGKIMIDMVDVWVWIFKTRPELANDSVDADGNEVGGVVAFSVLEDALTVRFGEVTEFFDAAEFWGWVFGEHIPEGLVSSEILFGVPQVIGSEMVINLAVGSHSDPRGWAETPKCHGEWETARKAEEAALKAQ